MYKAHRQRHTLIVVAYFIIALLLVWGVRHIENLIAVSHGQHPALFTLIYASAFFLLAWQVIAYSLEKPYTTTKEQDAELDTQRVIVNVPVCNEDYKALEDCIKSLVLQTRRIDLIHVVVNGPNTVDYTKLAEKTSEWGKKNNHAIYWTWQEVAGKRQAQKTTALTYLKPEDIFLTVDSDAYLDEKAVEEGIKPLADKRVQSVAGIVLTMNNRKKFMTRMQDLWFLVGQLVDRSANSTFGAVLVNSGVLAFYRGELILDHIEGYTNETFMGRKIEFSDDSLLTIYALSRGKGSSTADLVCLYFDA
jgi:hyaluronan synthase